jgi:alpha-1,3-rhamnosyl/mannosyltransferase
MNFRARRAGVNAMLHLGGTLPKHSLRGARQTVLIHDLQPVQVGDNFSPTKRWYLRWALGRAVRNADRVIVPSQDVRTQIAHVYGTAAAERVRVVYHGTPTAQEVAGEVRPVPQVDGERFLLFPAAHWAHKGHRDFIDVMAQLPELHLALAGGETEHTGDIRARIDQAGLGDRIHVLGRVDEPELRWLYRNAEAVVLPSEYEGFGLPVVEAAAYGTAPLVSDITVFDEFLPVGAPRLRRNNTKSWPQTIRTVIDDPGYASRLAADVLSKNSALTWKATVDGWVRAVTDR